MFQVCLVIKEDLREEQASMVVSGHESLEGASEAILKIFNLVEMIFSIPPGESYTIYSEGSEIKDWDPPNSVGVGGESRPVF